MSEWYTLIESRVFTQVQVNLKKKYPKLNCSTSSESVMPAKFPTLYLYEKQDEMGQDLYNGEVAAVSSTIYIRVWTNTTEKECKDILAAATLELKKLHYNIRYLPSANLTDKIAFGEIMARRVIGNADGIAR